MKGYLKDAEVTEKTVDADGWLHTGDVVFCDEEGFYYVVDRPLKDLIKVDEMQVSPSETENVLMLHENVVEAVVIGIADEHSGEAPKAFVVLKDASRGVDEIAHFASIQKLVPHKYLRGGIEVPEEMPKSASGKTLRRVLRERIGEH
ncbi:hypothetical protein QR680_002930 [Steinernema hermaphroditum]|uniref:AMP-binding enzyme C-terminal domain-containing protein n=1 Tax=Steinernema hermaphroditum TaxID=289476 RepID=A0AA39H4S8_9BILA|nr:hypothetical protein QR680_002930 [Steinernema hermaphroditum]